MSVYETVERTQKQALLAVHHINELVFDLVKPFAGTTARGARILREFPYVDKLPSARESVEQWFGFFDDVFKEEREFLLHVVDLLPERKVTAPAVKSTSKAA